MLVNRLRSIVWGKGVRKRPPAPDDKREKIRRRNVEGLPATVLYLRDVFGGDFTERDSDVSCQTTATEIVKNDPERISLTIINLGANNVYVKPGNNPSSTSGILLTASGGAVSLDVRSDGTLPSREWYGVADTAASDLFVLEMRRYAQFPNA